MKVNRKKIQSNGFTLVELLAVIAILVIIMLIALPNLSSSIERKEIKSLELVKGTIESAGEIYYQSHPEVCYIDVQTLIDEDYLDVADIRGYTSGYLVYNTETNSFEYTEEEPGDDSFCHISLNFLKAAYGGTAESNYLGTSIKRNQIKSVVLKNYISGHVINNTDCWDVSSTGTKDILLWVESTTEVDGTTYYNIAIGQEGGVSANPRSDGLFSHLSNVTSIDLTYFNTKKATDMSEMFFKDFNLTSIDLSSFDTSNVTRMDNMFSDCSKLISIDLSSFDTSKVTSMFRLFFYCSNLISLDLRNINTSKVTNMSEMFHGCSSLVNLDLSSFDTSKVTNMSTMFSGCSKLISLNVNNFDTSKVTNMTSMFYGCSSLVGLDLSSFDTSNVTGMSHMFFNCSNLTNLDMRKMTFDNVTSSTSIFSLVKSNCQITVKSNTEKNWILDKNSAFTNINTVS